MASRFGLISRAVSGANFWQVWLAMAANETTGVTPRSTIERYFSLHYARGRALPADVKKSDDVAMSGRFDTCVARHHNGLCVLCLSPKHPLLTGGSRKVASVEFMGVLRAVRGKRKRGGTCVEADSRLCRVTDDDGQTYDVRCSVRGVLVERNEALILQPQLIATAPLTDGYLAVILPHSSERATAVQNLTSAQDYGGGE